MNTINFQPTGIYPQIAKNPNLLNYSANNKEEAPVWEDKKYKIKKTAIEALVIGGIAAAAGFGIYYNKGIKAIKLKEKVIPKLPEKKTFEQYVKEKAFTYKEKAFAYEENGIFIPEATTFLMVGKGLAYLLCVLNSPLSEWFFSKIGTTTGVGTVRWKKFTIQELLIPNIGIQMFQQFDYLVRKYTKKEMSSKQLSSHANQILYKIVGLTEDEVLYVENFYPPIL